MKRHIGKIINTDQRCVVVYMQIPGRETHALVVSTDNLPLSIESPLMSVLESQEGQADPVLANVLARKLMPDTGQALLNSLHHLQLLHPIPIDNIVMLPMPNMPFPLRAIIEQMGGSVPPAENSAPEISQAEKEKFNPYGQTQEIESSAQNKGIASGLLVEASLLMEEARRKQEQAYRYDPSLRPAEIQTGTKIDVTSANAVETKEVKRTTRRKKTEA